MTTPTSRTTTSQYLARAGFYELRRAVSLLEETTNSGLNLERRVELFATAADPDQALLGLVRWLEAAPAQQLSGWVSALADDEKLTRLIRVLGGSAALTDYLAADPGLVELVCAEQVEVPTGFLAPLLHATTLPDPTDQLRLAYRAQLLRIAAWDLNHPEPLEVMPQVGRALAELADAALEGALVVARSQEPQHAKVRLAVIGMGKCGGRELNYISDVDVIYVAEPADETVTPDEVITIGTALAAGLAKVCAGPSQVPALWPVDAGLRPEGNDGPLVRTLASHLAYYQRWAKTWEFQALLKARPVAGDLELGQAYRAAIDPLVWAATGRDNFVADSQAMRRRVEENVPPAQADRQLKLGAGGLRDVEFTVQLLQLVHGRGDESIRSRGTLRALEALSDGGYVARDDAGRLHRDYRFLRLLEHRLQLWRMRRTHLMPTADTDLRRLARAVGYAGEQPLVTEWQRVRREVRGMHQELFYRPLLSATAELSLDEAVLNPQAAQTRLEAIGYRDPAGAMRHLSVLTEGVSRRAAIQRHLLPVMIEWFAEGPLPDQGLAEFRTLSEKLGRTHWYLKLLRDSGSAAKSLARLLSTSRYAAQGLARSPETIAWLDDDRDLVRREVDRLLSELQATLSRGEPGQPAAAAIMPVRAMRRRELTRTALADLLGQLPFDPQRAITDAAELALIGGLEVSQRAVLSDFETAAPTRIAIIAMGRLGGRELSYASDADVILLHDPNPGFSLAEATTYATAVSTELRSLLGSTAEEPALPVDVALRPEGRNGPIIRSYESCVEYYSRWIETWEIQALLRARPVAGDSELGERFINFIDPIRYPHGGISQTQAREIKRVKARIEAERLPRSADPNRHVKLGRGGLSDVEWTAQLLQLQHAWEIPELRTTSTVDALGTAVAHGILAPQDGEHLVAAWQLASRIRDANVLASGRTSGQQLDMLPTDWRALNTLAQILHYPSGAGQELEQEVLRSGRRARDTMDRVFYG